MPVNLQNNPIILEPSKQITIPEKKIELIDIVGKIIIDTDNHLIEFDYNYYSYIRNENGEIETTQDGKKKVFLVERKHIKIGENYYSDIANSILSEEDKNLELGKIIEKKLVALIKQLDQNLQNIQIEYVDSEDIEVVNFHFPFPLF